jgi:hypothetical protein
MWVLPQVEFGEVEEPIPNGSLGSSTMPQKRNPKLCMVGWLLAKRAGRPGLKGMCGVAWQEIIVLETELRSLMPLAVEVRGSSWSSSSVVESPV